MKSSTYANELLTLEFCNTPMAGLGDTTGPRGSTTAGSYYVALHTASPGVGGTQATSEVSYTGYARVAVARDSSHWTVSGSSVTPTNSIQFPARIDNASTVARFWSLGDALSGATKMRRFGAIGTAPKPFEALTSDTLYAAAHGLSVNDEIVFWALTDQALPTGITEGTVYFVKTVPDVDSITIAATAGGATIDITASGGGRWQKVSGMTITQNVIPIFVNTTTIEEA